MKKITILISLSLLIGLGSCSSSGSPQPQVTPRPPSATPAPSGSPPPSPTPPPPVPTPTPTPPPAPVFQYTCQNLTKLMTCARNIQGVGGAIPTLLPNDPAQCDILVKQYKDRFQMSPYSCSL